MKNSKEIKSMIAADGWFCPKSSNPELTSLSKCHMFCHVYVDEEFAYRDSDVENE